MGSSRLSRGITESDPSFCAPCRYVAARTWAAAIERERDRERPHNGAAPEHRELAKIAGETIAASPGATVVDAIVMASAASRGDVVYASDFNDLSRLRENLRAVRILSV